MSADIQTCPHCGHQTEVDAPEPNMEVVRVTPYSPHSTYDARAVCEECNESLGIYFEVTRSAT